MSASTWAGRTTTSRTTSRRRVPSLPTSRPATTTPSSVSTPARKRSGARGFSAPKSRAADATTNAAARAVSQGFEENIFGQHKIIDLFTAGARVGYAWDRLLVFATGGFASAHIENAHCSTITGIRDAPGPGNGVVSNNRGWYAGGGFDY